MLIQNWTFYYDDLEPLPCTAPCTMYSVLLDHKKIPDPFYGLNERELQCLAEKDCRFETVITADEALLAKDYLELCFKGLDTLCHIYLNDNLLDKVKNMHREYCYDVKEFLVLGENKLVLEFKSPTKYFAEKNSRHFLRMNGDSIPGASHLRKAYYESGWDWGPTLPDMGIWRDVQLNAYNFDRIDDVAIRQYHENGKVSVEVTVATKHNADCKIYATLDGKRVLLENGHGVVEVTNPRLWWVRGYGQQPLYALDIELVYNSLVIETLQRKLGLRTLTVCTDADPINGGNEFCFVINGVKIFSMGANYIPMDNLLSRVTNQRLEDHIQWALDANFNTLRIWGGGYYPEDYFYDLCDQYGIIVWQDFMVACANIWLTTEMAEEFTQEAIYNLKRLRHHASLALLAGNNEMEDGVISWGSKNNRLVQMDYLQLYEHLLPELCQRYAPDTFYWPSSPSSGGGFDDPANPTKGDSHYWAVWHGSLPFTAYRELHFRFCSEYGFESFPDMKTIRTFCEEKDMNCFSQVMENHQKCKGGNEKILRYLSGVYLYPTSFEALVYASQLLQADAIKYGVEHFRRDRGYCMGSTYWQFNDCWPVASWSSVDSFGRYKALHYAAKKFYAPVAMGLFLERDKLTVNVSNETMADFQGEVRLTLRKNDFTVLESEVQAISVKALTSNDVLAYDVPDVDKHECYLVVELYDADGNFIMRQVELMIPAKHYHWQKPTIQTSFQDTDEGVEITVSSDVFAKGVFIDFENVDCVLSDNFFALTDNVPYRVVVRTAVAADELSKLVNVKTVYNIR